MSNTEWFGSVSCLDDPALKVRKTLLLHRSTINAGLQNNVFLFLWLQGLAEKYKKTVPQVVLRWGIQRNTVVIPKTSKLERLEENFRVLDFELAKEDMDLIGSLDRKHRTNQPAKFWGIDLYA